jgi:hypothetical protein
VPTWFIPLFISFRPGLQTFEICFKNGFLFILKRGRAQKAHLKKKYPNGVPAYNFKEHSKTYNADAPFAAFELSY